MFLPTAVHEAEGQEAYKKLGAVQEEFLKYARKPLPEELS